MKRILLSILVMASLMVGLVGLTGCETTAPRPFPPPEGYSSWDEYNKESQQQSAPAPTPVPAPTQATVPAPVPVPVLPPPAPVPQPIPEPEPIEFSGLGDDVSPKFTLEEGITIITMTHNGESNFAIELLDNAGDTVDLFVNEIGAFEGSKALGVRSDNFMGAKPGIHLLNITADANWTVQIKQPRPITGEALPINIAGKGYSVSNFFVLGEGLTTFSMTHDGNSNFAIVLLSTYGEVEELLVNEIGSYTGKQAIGVKQGNIIGAKPGMHILSITADGNWTVSISQ